jgi:sulfur carrier protein ThiS
MAGGGRLAVKLTVYLFGDLRRVLPRGQDLLDLDMPEGSTALDMLRQIGIHPGEVWVPEDQPLKDGDFVEVFEPVGGGA